MKKRIINFHQLSRPLPRCSLAEICGEDNQIAISLDEIFRHLFPEGFFQLGLKVEFLLSPDDAFPEVLQSSSSLLGSSTKINDVVQVSFTSHGLRNVFIDLLKNLKVAEPEKFCSDFETREGGTPTCAVPRGTPPRQGAPACPPEEVGVRAALQREHLSPGKPQSFL